MCAGIPTEMKFFVKRPLVPPRHQLRRGFRHRRLDGVGTAQVAQYLRERRRVDRLQHIIVRARRKRLVEKQLAAQVRRDDYRRPLFEFGKIEVGKHAESVKIGHDQIEHYRVGEQRLRFGDRVKPVFRARDDLEVIDRRKRIGEFLSNILLVVDDQKFDVLHKMPPFCFRLTFYCKSRLRKRKQTPQIEQIQRILPRILVL